MVIFYLLYLLYPYLFSAAGSYNSTKSSGVVEFRCVGRMYIWKDETRRGRTKHEEESIQDVVSLVKATIGAG